MKGEMGQKLKSLRKERKITRKKLGELIGVSEYAVRDWEIDRTEINTGMLKEILKALAVSSTYFFEDNRTRDNENKIPILGTIRAGLPILAQENILGHVRPPEGVKADFCLFVEGDSMIPVYHPNILIYIKEQPIVEHGEVAAVLVENENATLKKVRFKNGMVQLIPFNVAKYDVTEYKPENIRIIGKVVYPGPLS